MTTPPASAASSSSLRPRVALLLTGGTIGSGGTDDLDRLDYVDLAHVLTDEEAMPLYRLPDDVDVSVRRFARIRSNDADLGFWRRLRQTIIDLARDEPDLAGVVVAHGTATLEETAYFLHLTLPTYLPVVLVGAQRPPTSIGSDAQINLLSAVRVAAAPETRGHGVVVVMDDRILSARDVQKASSHALDAFQARTHGPIGDVDAYGGVWFYRKDLRRHTVDSAFATLLDGHEGPLAPVEIVPVWSGVDARPLQRAVADGALGLVLAALPPGMLPHAVELAADELVATGTAIVMASRAATGRVTRRRGLAARGIVGSDTLSLPAARILLALCLTAGLTTEQIHHVFSTH